MRTRCDVLLADLYHRHRHEYEYDSHNPKPHDNLSLLPAEQMKVVMDGRAQEETLALLIAAKSPRKFEPTRLKYDAAHLKIEHAADQQQ